MLDGEERIMGNPKIEGSWLGEGESAMHEPQCTGRRPTELLLLSVLLS